MADHLGLGIPQQVFGAFVEDDDEAVRVRGDNGHMGGRIQHRLALGIGHLEPSQNPFGLFELFDHQVGGDLGRFPGEADLLLQDLIFFHQGLDGAFVPVPALGALVRPGASRMQVRGFG